ncbi:MAG: trimethylamine methyltransferase family protein [Bacillota bacterium]|nr:trimethylamine methyltransferase family protein [Bacillota bacterium]
MLATVLTEEQVNKLHETTLDILANTGVDFLYEPALEYFKKAGFKVEGTRVYFTEEEVEKYLAMAPDLFTLYGRNGIEVPIGGTNTCFVPGYGAPFVNEDNKNRQATLADFANFAKLAGTSPYIDVTGGVLVEPNDISEKIRHKEMTYNLIKHSAKPFMGSANGKQEALDTLKMAEVVFGKEYVAEKPVMISLINSLTPLKFDERMLAALVEYAEVGQAVIIASLTMAGSTGPATIAGTLALQNTEVVAGIILTQVIKPGTPVVYGAPSSITDMRFGSLAIGAPETVLIITASAQLARKYGVPVRGGGSLSDSKIPDNQASYEAAVNMLGTTSAGVNFVLHAAGILQYYNAMSFEKFMLDEEVCGMVKRIKRGIEINTDTLALDIIKEVGPGGEYLTAAHTFQHCRTEYFKPTISDRTSYDVWNMEKLTAVARAKANMAERLENATPQIDKETDEALRKLI